LEPDEARLRELLRAARPAPPALPLRFQEAVWRRIERGETTREAVGPLPWIDQLVERLLRPRLALAGIAALLLVSGLAGVLSGAAAARQAAQARYVSAVAPSALH
jgi:hypothetical protein